MYLEVVAAGWGTTIQDAGRGGFADIGVPTSGALDAELRALLNRLVGNSEGAAVLETLGGLRIRPAGAVVVATSADRAPLAVPAGETIEVAPAPGTLWGYVAVRGGIAVEPVLGSRSHDSRSGLGPPPVTTGSAPADRPRSGYAARGRAGAAATVAPGRRRVARPAHRLVRRRRAGAVRGDDVDRVPGRQPRRCPLSTDRRSAGGSTTSCRARDSSPAPCRSPPTAGRSSCSPTTRRPAGTPSWPSSTGRPSPRWCRLARARRCGSALLH